MESHTWHDSAVTRSSSAFHHGPQTLSLSPAGERIEDIFRKQRNRIERNAERIFDGIDDCRSRAVHRQFANSFRAIRSMNVAQLLKVNPNGRQIGGSRNDVIRHLAVLHAALIPNSFFIKRKADSLSYAANNL